MRALLLLISLTLGVCAVIKTVDLMDQATEIMVEATTR